MSSSPPPPFVATSPISPSTARHARARSRFSYKALSLLAASSPASPLRCVAHIDLDAFYAQCEMVRLGVPADTPLAVQQWQGLIAINYAARAHGLTRHVSVDEARRKCPALVCQHVATWKEGETAWAYHADAARNMAAHKVSLDPYRLESRRILAVIRDALPAPPLQRVEKASVDEVFLDLSAHVHALLLERFPELRGPPPYNDPSERLPAPPCTALPWSPADALAPLPPPHAEEHAPDWDDVALQLAADVVRGVRAAVRAALRYTASAGVAPNKMLAKLASAHRKPDGQTVVRARAAPAFLAEHRVTQIRSLGGKLGDDIVARLGTDSVPALRDVPAAALRRALGAETAAWLAGALRGADASEVTPRTAIKSMLSAKSFRPPLNTPAHAGRWLRVFAADLAARLADVADGRRPRTLNLHHRQGAAARSRSAQIPAAGPLTAERLAALANDLLAGLVVDGRAWPCANLSLSVAGFDDVGAAGTRSLDAFVVKGAPPPASRGPSQRARERDDDGNGDGDGEHERPAKRARPTINAFFSRAPPAEPASFDEVPSAQAGPSADGLASFSPDDIRSLDDLKNDVHDDPYDDDDDDEHLPGPSPTAPQNQDHTAPTANGTDNTPTGPPTYCPECNAPLAPADAAEHADWHVAAALQRAEQHAASRAASTAAPSASARRGGATATGAGKRGRPPRGGGGGGGGVERGQRRLQF